MIEKDFHKQPTCPGMFPSEAAPAAALPSSIGPFKPDSLLNEQGGMSILYLATHPETKEPVTVKVLSPRYLSNPDIVQRFLEEARIVQLADHPNIIKLYGQGEWEGGLYIAMEFVEGTSLRQHILQMPISLTRALEIIIDIAYALCHLHTHGVIHRDLKPENILLTENGQVKVIDFGIAQLLVGTDATPSQGRMQFLGTPVYMSPEQRSNPESVSYPADIYSLAIIAYELILGKLSHGQIYLSLMPKGIQKILQKALQPNQKDRYQDVVDFIADISAYYNKMVLEKERRTGDPIGEIVESLQHAQDVAFSQTYPLWEQVEIGLAGHHGPPISGVFYDFFEGADGSYGCFVAESQAGGADGAIYAASLRGMMRGIRPGASELVDAITKLNQMVQSDPIQQLFSLHYLLFSPKDNQFHYLACGQGSLWLLKADGSPPTRFATDNPSLGTPLEKPLVAITHPWEVGDTLFLNSFAKEKVSSPQEFSESLFEQAITQNVNRTPQKQAEAILRKARITASRGFRSAYVISVLRKA